MVKDNMRVIIHHPPVVNDEFVRALLGTDVRGLAEKIRRGEYDHIIRRGKDNEKGS